VRRSIYVTAVVAGLAGSAMLTSLQPRASAHCEVPCGIYGDHARITQMLEDTTTIAKATDQILVLNRKNDAVSVNQATRWVMNKEEHATRIQHTIAQYFLSQRVKPKAPGTEEYADYVTRLTEHHAVMVAAMKTKQTVDPGAVDALRRAVERIGRYYQPEGHEHEGRRGG